MHLARVNAGNGVYGISVAMGPKGLFRNHGWNEHGIGRSVDRRVVETFHARRRRDGDAYRVAIFCCPRLYYSSGAHRVYRNARLPVPQGWSGRATKRGSHKPAIAYAAILSAASRNGHDRGFGDDPDTWQSCAFYADRTRAES